MALLESNNVSKIIDTEKRQTEEKIEKNLNAIKDIFGNIQNQTALQHEHLDHLSSMIEKTQDNINSSNFHLEKVEEKKERNRFRRIVTIGGSAVIVTGIMSAFIVSYFKKH